MPIEAELNDVIDRYLGILSKHGAICPKVVKTMTSSDNIEELAHLENVSITNELETFFSNINGYDLGKCVEYDVYDPEFAWGMNLLSIKDAQTHYDQCYACADGGDPNYWPVGFLPILWGGSGSYVVVNCIKESPTYGAVYDMSEGVGCNMVSKNIIDFIKASSKEVELGIRKFSEGEYSVIQSANYLDDCAKIYGNTPYFRRKGKMGTQIIDWL